MDHASIRELAAGAALDDLDADERQWLALGLFLLFLVAAIVISDDAARVWVDGRLVMERNEPGGSEVMNAIIAPGRHDVRVAFYQLDGWTELRVELVRGTARSVGSAGPH